MNVICKDGGSRSRDAKTSSKRVGVIPIAIIIRKDERDGRTRSTIDGKFNEETLRIEFNELPVYWLLSVDRCVNRSCLKCSRGQAFRSEGGTSG